MKDVTLLKCQMKDARLDDADGPSSPHTRPVVGAGESSTGLDKGRRYLPRGTPGAPGPPTLSSHSHPFIRKTFHDLSF